MYWRNQSACVWFAFSLKWLQASGGYVGLLYTVNDPSCSFSPLSIAVDHSDILSFHNFHASVTLRTVLGYYVFGLSVR